MSNQHLHDPIDHDRLYPKHMLVHFHRDSRHAGNHTPPSMEFHLRPIGLELACKSEHHAHLLHIVHSDCIHKHKYDLDGNWQFSKKRVRLSVRAKLRAMEAAISTHFPSSRGKMEGKRVSTTVFLNRLLIIWNTNGYLLKERSMRGI